MTMKLEDSFRYQTEREAELHRNLRALFPDNDAIVAHIEASYRQGWNDCFAAARLHGVDKLS